jgi:hypothetical protein
MKLLPVIILTIFLFSGCDSLRGPTGPQGEHGEKGETGVGEKGEKGDTGGKGDKGEKGETVYTEISVDEEKGSLFISESSWSYEKGLFSSGPLVVTGLAKNVGTTILEYVEIHIKAYNSADQIISSDYDYLDVYYFNPGHEIWFKITDYGCNKEPNKVTLGYCFDTTVFVPAPKISSGAKLN